VTYWSEHRAGAPLPGTMVGNKKGKKKGAKKNNRSRPVAAGTLLVETTRGVGEHGITNLMGQGETEMGPGRETVF
jgi:hypothetical protein